MGRVEIYISRIFWLVAVSVLLVVPTIGQSNETGASGTCAGLYCESYGSGDPIIALHGLGGTLYSWRNLKYSFPNHRLILIDLKGAGNSPKPHDKHYSIKDQADLILRFIHENDLKNLTLMGNSYGGAVALFLAIELCKDPASRLVSLILIDSGGYNRNLPSHLTILRTPLVGWLVLHLVPPRCLVRKVLRDSYYNPKNITDPQINVYAKAIASPGGRYGLLQTAKQAIPKNINEITAQYKTISVPTLILWGSNDRLIPITIGETLHGVIKKSTLELVPKSGHVPQEEQPDDTMRYITAFFRRLGQTP
jgi:pimeloyl-ACP methyl ester carboxylesterase